MKTLLNLTEPSADWRGLAHVIAKSTGLRDDVTLVVEKEGVRFYDEERREIQTSLPPGTGTRDSITLLSTKLFLLKWLYDHFSKPGADLDGGAHRSPRAGSFFRLGDAPDIRSVAIQSTF
jgi:hypothetical protein